MPSYISQLDTSAQVTLLYGDSEILKQRATNVIIDARLTLEQREDGLSSVVASEYDPNQLAAELGSRSLLAAERTIVLKRVDDLNADDQRVLAAALERLPDTTSVVLTCAQTSKGRKPRVAKELAEAVKQAGQAVYVASPDRRDLHQWITAEAERCGKTITRQAVALLQELSDDDVDMLVGEIEKVATYIGERGQIEQADVEAVGFSSQHGDIWNMMDAIGNRQPAPALQELERRLPPGATAPAIQIRDRRILFRAT